MRYALMIYVANDLSPADYQETLQRHKALQKSLVAKGQLLVTAQLDPAPPSVVRRDALSDDILDGPYIETKELLIGFYLLDCDTQAEAEDAARQICPTEGHIQVRPVRWMHQLDG